MLNATILGAGASVAAGYPTAAGIPLAIRNLIEFTSGDPNARRLHQWCEETLQSIEKHRCSSIDELAFILRKESGPSVLRAKAVMTALFLHLEAQADLMPYRRLAREMIDFTDLAVPGDGQVRVPSSRFCINYNYDRCLEAAIYQEFQTSRRGPYSGYTASDLEVRVQRLINSGLDTMRERYDRIDMSRFSLLKMHGLIGTLWNDHYPGGEPLWDFGNVAVDDRLLAAFDCEHVRASPTMIFSHGRRVMWQSGCSS